MLFALGAQNAIHRIGRASRRLVIVPDLHLSQQSDRQHIQSGEEQHRREDHQRTVLHQQVRIVEDFLYPQPSRDRESVRMLTIPTVPKKCERTRQVAK